MSPVFLKGVSVTSDSANSPPHTSPSTVRADSVAWPNISTQNQLETASITLRNGGQIYPTQGKKIGEILKTLGVIDDKVLDAVEKRHHTKKAKDKPTGELLVYMGIIDAEVLNRALCIQSGVLMVDVQAINIPYNVLKLVSNENARAKHAIPVGTYHGILYLAVADPLNFSEQHFFSFSTGLKIKPVFTTENQIITGLNSKWTEHGSEIWAG
jgi:Type II secretion system (T2SS), protein E, N-terminal domain